MKNAPIRKNWFYIFSPCVITAVILIVGLLTDSLDGGWSMFGIAAGIPLLCITVVIGIITKVLIRKNNLLLWIVEIVLMTVSFLELLRFGK